MQAGEKKHLLIRSMGASGEGIASPDGLVVFIEGALPGEEILGEITVVKKNYAKAKLLEVVKPSPERVEAPCPVFGRCGGCQLQNMTYRGQLEAKRQRVVDAMERIGHLKVEVAPCVPSKKEYGYRNKIQLPVEGKVIGLYMHGSHTIVPIEGCLIHCPLGEAVFQKVRRMEPPKKGKIRYVLIKSAVKRGEVLVVLVTTGLEQEWLEKFADGLDVRGVVENVNTRVDNVILGTNFRTIKGDPYIEEELCGKVFRVSGHSFFQVNTEQAEALFQKVLELADLKGTETLLDAFCGVGTFALIAADHVKQVVGVECVKLAIEDAKANAERNGVKNVRFIHGRAEQVSCNADVTFLNPPRKGCEESLLKALKSERVIYMSCNPATLARDLERLKDYRVEAVIPYDMFPQTTHVETVAKLVRR